MKYESEIGSLKRDLDIVDKAVPELEERMDAVASG
jgi:hypothetical protein